MRSDSTTLIVRVPTPLVERVDNLAERAGMNRSQLVRLLLSRADEGAIPSGLLNSGNELRLALQASA
jgi:hypothetical protein